MVYHVLLLDLSRPPDGALAGHLVRSGFLTDLALDCESAVRLLRQHELAAGVVRVGKGRGQIEAALRAFSALPLVVVATAVDSEFAVRCLEAGADTVLAAPLSRRVLAARLQALLRSRSGIAADGLPEFVPHRVGDLVVDPGSHAVTKDGASVPLTPTEFRLLLALARREGAVVHHARLLSEVWGAACSDGREKLRLYVRYLREKLEDDRAAPRLVINERGVGYRLAAAQARGSHGHER